MDYQLCADIAAALVAPYASSQIDCICSVESRGFLFGMLMAQQLKVPFVPIRKKGKLPGKTVSVGYDLEYGTSIVEIHTNFIEKDWRVLIHDDLLATGGTAIAAAQLIEMEHGKVAGFSFVVELEALGGNKLLQSYCQMLTSLVRY